MQSGARTYSLIPSVLNPRRILAAERPALYPLDGRARVCALATFAVLAVGCATDGAPSVTLQGADGKSIEITVEIARTAEQQRRGLMWRQELADDHGMLFVFAREAPRSFWMKNTIVSLDILYIDSESRIVSIAHNTTPYSTKAIPSDGPALYVLEVAAGTCRRHGILPGSSVRLPKLLGEPRADS